MTAQSWTSEPDGLTLVGERHPGSGPLVVLLHSGFLNRTSWRTAVTELGAVGAEVVTMDLRGHGESDRSPEARYGVHDQVGDLVAVLEGLDRRPMVVGNSLGGGIALAVAGHPDPAVRDLVGALVLVDVVPRLQEGGRDRVRDFVQTHAQGFASMEEAAELVAEYTGAPPRPGRGLMGSLHLAEDGRYRWHWDPRMVTDGLDQYGEEQIEQQLAAAGRLTVPTLLLRGERSDVVGPEGAAEFMAHATGATYREVAGAGHMVTPRPGDPFVAEVIAFLTGLGLPEAAA